MTVRILSQVQVVGMGFLQRVHGVTLRDNVRSCEMCNTLNVEPLLRIGRSHNCGGWPCFQNATKKIAGEVLLTTPTGKWPRGCPGTRWSDYIYDLA